MVQNTCFQVHNRTDIHRYVHKCAQTLTTHNAKDILLVPRATGSSSARLRMPGTYAGFFTRPPLHPNALAHSVFNVRDWYLCTHINTYAHMYIRCYLLFHLALGTLGQFLTFFLDICKYVCTSTFANNALLDLCEGKRISQFLPTCQ